MYTDNELDEYIKRIVTKKISEPPKYEDIIRNAFNDKRDLYIRQRIMQIVPIMCCMMIFMSGMVYAEEITKFFESLFTNSTESIDASIQNGYLQNAEMGYVYDNDIGIKVKDVVMDGSKLNVSFLYEFKERHSIETIRLKEYEICDDNGSIWYKGTDDYFLYEEIPVINNVFELNDGFFIDNNHFAESILYGSDEFPEIKSLNIKVKSLYVNGAEIINGNWDLFFEVDDIFNKREVIEYIPNNEHVIDSKITLSETTLKVYIELDEKYEFEDIYSLKIKPYIEDTLGNQYFFSDFTCNNTAMGSKYDININFSKYYNKINRLYLIMNLSEKNCIRIELNKK